MISKNMNLEDIIKRDLYNKFNYLIIDIKNKVKNNLTEEEKKKILKQISCLILLFQMDNLYKDVTSISAIESILQLFGLSEKNANLIRKLGSKSINITSLALFILTYLKTK